MNRAVMLILASALTAAVFFASKRLHARVRIGILHPVLWSTVGVVAAIEATGRWYQSYRPATAWMTWLLGPAVVALAVPVYQQRALLRAHAAAVLGVVVAAAAFGVGSVWAIYHALGADPAAMRALALKAVTAPVALALAHEAGASPALAAAGVMVSALLGATAGPLVLARLRHHGAIGLALGCTSHGVGTARALEMSGTAGAFASLGMGLSAILMALAGVPILERLP